MPLTFQRIAHQFDKIRDGERSALGSVLAVALVMTLCLWWNGRVWWCEAGDPWPWSWDVWSKHNSQHLLDPYSLSHIEHGLGLFLVLSAMGGRWFSSNVRTLVVATVEAVWEAAENTSFMIERYREATISLDYYGDSILNSLSDYGLCMAGLILARKLPWRGATCVFVMLEISSIVWIRDSLFLNMLMLTFPIDVIRQWQLPA